MALKITGGEFRGRPVKTPPTFKTRPTQAKLREALFSSIQAHLPDAHVLDLFAGSGALSWEALSRGAADAILVENDRQALRVIRENIEYFGLGDRVQLIAQSFERAYSQLLSRSFDLVLADPPYRRGFEQKLLEWDWEKILSPGGRFVLEAAFQKQAPLPDETTSLVKVREKAYGETVLVTYSLKETPQRDNNDEAKEI